VTPATRPTELSVNVDHVATLRQARGGDEPDPARAAVLALDAGAAGITVHLREDRRHIQDRDLEAIRALRRGDLNLEMALTDEMVQIAIATRPERVTLVPEKRAELTTEGGLDLHRDPKRLEKECARLVQAGLTISLFLDPDPEIAQLARDTGASIVEIHTGHYANARGADSVERELQRVAQAAKAFEAVGPQGPRGARAQHHERRAAPQALPIRRDVDRTPHHVARDRDRHDARGPRDDRGAPLRLIRARITTPRCA
jgi:pyridoxine 5-phosphate synthase